MIYFNEFLINDDAIASLTNHYKLFTDNFYLGATASNTFELSCGKQFIQLQPNKVLIDDGINSFHLYVDNMKEDGAFFKYTLTDKMLNFNFKYSAEELIENNREYGQSTTTIQDILEDICLKANVECSYTIQSTNHIIDWWDDRLLARDYISFIAAKEGGFARIDENDELVIIPHNSLSKQTINTEDIEELTVGEHTIISRVVHDNGVHKWEFGDATGRTIYLDTSNVFILEEEDVEYIYNQINGFEFYSVNVSNCIFNPEIRAGDVITFKHGDDEYPTIAQYSTSFAGGQWVGSVNLDIKTIKQEETSILNVSDSVKAINTYIDRANAEFKILIEQVDNNKVNITDFNEELEEINNLMTNLEENVAEFNFDLTGLSVNLSKIGGSNLIQNSVGYYKSDWENVLLGYSNTEIKNNTQSKNVFVLDDNTDNPTKQEIQVVNGIYTISWKYKKLINLAECKLIINEEEFDLDELDWTDGSYTFEVLSNLITIELISDTDNACWLSDLMGNLGTLAQVWSSAPGESVKGGTKIGEGIEITSSISNKKITIDNDGMRGWNTDTDEVVMESTTEGAKFKKIEAQEAEIAEVIFVDMGTETWLTRI